MADAPAPYRIQGATGDWEVVIGLEVHAQVVSKAKLFSGASTEFGAEPNSQVSLIDAAMPGMLPVPNRECIRQAVRTGMALEAKINRWSRFDRKNYFYPDLPQGYQISQYKHPLVGEGEVLVDLGPGVARKVRIACCHPKPPRHTITRSLCSASISRTRKGWHRFRSAGSGRFAGGAHLTAAVTNASVSRSPSSRETEVG